MKILPDGSYVIEIDNRLLVLTDRDGENKITEEDFINALKAYNFDEFITILAEISTKLFNAEFADDLFWKKERMGFIIHKPSGQFINDFGIEYIANILLLSKSNKHKGESIKYKENIIGVFNIYNNSILYPEVKPDSPPSFLVPMAYIQFSSQQNPRDVFIRHWLMFQKSHELVDETERIDLDTILILDCGMSVVEYIRLCFIIFATIFAKPRFNIGVVNGSSIPGLNDVFTQEKLSKILTKLSTTKKDFVELDKKYNVDLKPEFTRTRYNPLWEKPIIKLDENDFIAPSLSAYSKGAIRGIYWIFENAKGKTFRDYFGKLFEQYCGIVLRDTFGIEKTNPGIKFGKEERQFFDWIVDEDGTIFLFETKGYQFPLNVLKTGDSKHLKKQIFDKLVGTIKQMYLRSKDIDIYDELKQFRNRNRVCIAVFYNIPMVSSTLYDIEIKDSLNNLEHSYPGIKDFKYIFLSVEELEEYSYVKDYISITALTERVVNTPGSGFSLEVKKMIAENKIVRGDVRGFMDRYFEKFYVEELGLPPSGK